MKKTSFILGVAIIVLFVAHHDALANNYKLLETIPGGPAAGTSPSLSEYIEAVYRFAIWFVGICAFIMVVVGGFMYVASAGNQALATTAKTVIKDAFFGLLAALFAWLLLNVINPNLTDIRINVESVQTEATAQPAP